MRAASCDAWPQRWQRLEATTEEHARLGFYRLFGECHPDIHAQGFMLHGARGELYGVSVGSPAYKLPGELCLSRSRRVWCRYSATSNAKPGV
ncbi:MAG: hypothetical protein ACK4PH_24190, partial [Aquincola tertiaricarbonis]